MRFRIGMLSAVCALTGSALAFSGSPAASAEDRPNVLIILTDDQRASADGYKMMPRLMAHVRDQGMSFRNAVATIPLCCPSRVSIFTGQYAHNHGTRFNGGKSWTLEEQKRSMQYTLRRSGYKTAMVGKFLNFWSANPPYFDRWATFQKPGYYDSTFNIDGSSVRTTRYSTTYIGGRAIDILNDFEASDETPWLMYVAPWAPHKPATPERQYSSAPYPAFVDNPARLETDRTDEPGYVEAKNANRAAVLNTRAKMLRTLLSVDDMAARILDQLAALGEDNTVVVFLSDNGFHWYEHKLTLKRFPYTQSVRIPMFMSWPNHLPAGEVRSNIVATIDVAPTIYDLAGVTPGYTVDGRSMLSSERDHILIEYWKENHEGAPPTWQAWWSPDAMYVQYENVAEVDRREYYGPDDPWQLENVFGNAIAGDEPPNQAELAATIATDTVCKWTSCP